MSNLNFSNMGLLPEIQTALKEAQYQEPTPIQKQAIPIVLSGQDLLGIAQTGTGKTAAFSLPILHLLSKSWNSSKRNSPRALILTPTRELAIQIHKSLLSYGKHLKLKSTVIFGGVGQGNQVRDLNAGVDILVATPGRLLDLIEQRYLNLGSVEIFVLDEADRMLDMGFVRDIKKILPLLPQKRHNLFFSATMPPEIQSLANSFLKSPRKIEVTPQSTTVERIDQSVYFVEKKDKFDLLLHLLEDNNLYKVLVFIEMKHLANKIAEKLVKAGVLAAAIHGNKSQGARQRAIEDFTNDKIRVLVATDIASRGIDIDGITHVINFEMSHIPENYVHRIGRTARAGKDGSSISFCTGEERSFLFTIEKITRHKMRIVEDHPFHSPSAATALVVSAGKAKARMEEGRRSNSNRNRRPFHRNKESQRNNKSARR